MALRESIERPEVYSFPAEVVVEFLKLLLVLPEGVVGQAGGGGRVVLGGLDAPVVEGEFLEVGEYGQGQLGGVGVAARLEGGGWVDFEGHAGLLGLHEHDALAAVAEGVVGPLDAAPHGETVLDEHLAPVVAGALLVAHVPAQALQEGIDELGSALGLQVVFRLVVVEVAREGLHEVAHPRLAGRQVHRLAGRQLHSPVR